MALAMVTKAFMDIGQEEISARGAEAVKELFQLFARRQGTTKMNIGIRLCDDKGEIIHLRVIENILYLNVH